MKDYPGFYVLALAALLIGLAVGFIVGTAVPVGAEPVVSRVPSNGPMWVRAGIGAGLAVIAALYLLSRWVRDEEE